MRNESDPNPLESFEQRKTDHIRHALDPASQANEKACFERITLRHRALPELNFADVSLAQNRLGEKVEKPFFISGMTAGHRDAVALNLTLAKAAEQTGWAMGVGSQRRQLFDSNATNEWRELRQQCPEVTLLGNLGIAQLITSTNEQVQQLAESIHAAAMVIHCNPLQECLQPEGTPQFAAGLAAIARLTELELALMVKETGCGFSKEDLTNLNQTNIKAIDISGFGGTHWGRIEGMRATKQSRQARAAKVFADWGISTVDSLINAKSLSLNVDIWASGGVRSGLDAAKCFALGAKHVGFAKPILAAAKHGVAAVVDVMEQIEYECKIALFCSGCQNLNQLSESDYVIK